MKQKHKTKLQYFVANYKKKKMMTKKQIPAIKIQQISVKFQSFFCSMDKQKNIKGHEEEREEGQILPKKSSKLRVVKTGRITEGEGFLAWQQNL